MKVIKIKENKDGSATIDCEITNSEKELFKKIYNKKRFSSKLITKALIEGISLMVKRRKK